MDGERPADNGPGQEELDLGIPAGEDQPDAADVNERISRQIREVADRRLAQDRAGRPEPLTPDASLQARLERKLAGIEANEQEVNSSIGAARQAETRDSPVAPRSAAQISEAEERARVRESDRRRDEQLAAREADVVERSELASAGRKRVKDAAEVAHGAPTQAQNEDEDEESPQAKAARKGRQLADELLAQARLQRSGEADTEDEQS